MKKRALLASMAASLMLFLSLTGTARASCTTDVSSASTSDLLQAIRCLENKIDALQGGSPDGTFFRAIVAFENYSCPAGWTPYVPAPGRFVIGARPGPHQAGPKVGATGTSKHAAGPAEQPWVALLYCQKL